MNVRNVRRHAAGSQTLVVDPATCRHTWYDPTDPPLARRYFYGLDRVPWEVLNARCHDCGCVATLAYYLGNQRFFTVESPFPIVIDVTQHGGAR